MIKLFGDIPGRMLLPKYQHLSLHLHRYLEKQMWPFFGVKLNQSNPVFSKWYNCKVIGAISDLNFKILIVVKILFQF